MLSILFFQNLHENCLLFGAESKGWLRISQKRNGAFVQIGGNAENARKAIAAVCPLVYNGLEQNDGKRRPQARQLRNLVHAEHANQ